MTPAATEAWMIDDYGRPEDLILGTQSVSELGEGDLLISVEAVSLNPLDLKLVSGSLREFMPVQFRFTPGSDVCGRVVSVGPNAAFRPGDRVVGMTASSGGMSKLAVLNTRVAAAQISDTADAAACVTVPEAGMTAMAILREAGPLAGKTVAVIGATGGIGLILCQLAARAGAQVVASAAGEDDADLVRTNGAVETVDYSTGDTFDLLRLAHPDGVDVLVDLINQYDALFGSAAVVKRGGRLISTLIGPDASAFPADVDVHYVRLAPSSADLGQLVEMVESGELVPTISLRFPFSQVPEAYVALRDQHVRGKIVVEIGR